MATSNVPRHDFAPAWLKIPSQDNLKSAASSKQSGQNEKPGRLKKDDPAANITGSHSHNSSSSRYNSDYSKLHRQHSFENYQENKRYLSSQAKYRHHSVDDDYYSYPYGHYNNYYNSYNTGYEKYSMQYGSQPSLLRPPSRQEAGKYQHPNSRFTGQVAGYPNYYDIYPQDYQHHGDPYYNNPYPARPGNGRKNLYERENRLSNPKNEGIIGNKDREYVDRSNKTDSSKDRNLFNDEFPLLNGRDDVYNQSNYLSTNGNSVWDNTLSSKPGNYFSKNEINFVDYQGGPRDNDRSHTGNGFYKSMNLNKSCSSPCPTDNRNNPKVTTSQPELSTHREMLKDNSDLSLEDNGSSQRNRSGNQTNQGFECSSPEEVVNGVNLLSVKDNGRSFLSSSLEAERRLLRQMGWNETEEDEYVITEDDKKEFQKLTNQAKQQQRNGLVRPLLKTWSPKHIPVYQPNAQELNEVSSSDSDSEDSC